MFLRDHRVSYNLINFYCGITNILSTETINNYVYFTNNIFKLNKTIKYNTVSNNIKIQIDIHLTYCYI
jgi:hypothetical protein